MKRVSSESSALNDRSSKLTQPNEFALARRNLHCDDSLSRDERIAKMQIARIRDALKGGMNVDKSIRRATHRAVSSISETARWTLWRARFPNTKTAARTLKVMVRQSLVLSGLASRRDYEKMISSVVNMYDPSFVLISTPNWRKEPLRPWKDLSGLEKYAWVTSGMMYERCSKRYVAFSLNLSMEDAAKSPAELKDPIRKRLGRALGREVEHMTMFCIERDSEGRSHSHGIYFGSLTAEQKKRLKSAGGEWDGSDSRRQRRTTERYGMGEAIGWGWYIHKDIGKDAEFYIPHELTRLGQAHYGRTTALLLPHFIAERDSTVSQKATSPTQTKVLEKPAPYSSPSEKVSTAILKNEANGCAAIPGHVHEGPQEAPESIPNSKSLRDMASTNKAAKSDSVSFGDIEDQPVHQPRLPEDSALDAMLVELDKWAATHFGRDEMQGELTR
ncbi:hypothetical protein [Aeromonas sp. QDB20]|uniref:hypothetical protein n=1 Tax=Aeromonas sp. QDB20 TaxID=2989835 RepID=UPI0022E59358|nr:hypothetical protein [Aeromonas sp. QDB20]